ncbi:MULTISPECIES: spore coat protein [Paenibacillus]|uniref:Spore coat protein n=1 Tax=Paenibacillus campinasensis TaxID=66347 RepID=A0A268EP59_9BACL|nr:MULTISPECIES: spore coat protein [Paenibacillus]MUG66074.1 spore coat protein [Paenibacillus campinasensis]PAD74912.1 spore coat protein [Paenibacillus campinasensis]PAK50067.1 spore coat protein [Paenibacillus sp. 7541]
MATQNEASFLPQEELLNFILGELKRTVREYTTATTEASCPTVRQMFTNLTMDTLKLQGEMYHLIQQQNQYSASIPHALKMDVDKQHQQAQQTVQKTRDLISQKSAGIGTFAHTPNVGEHPANVSPPTYM